MYSCYCVVTVCLFVCSGPVCVSRRLLCLCYCCYCCCCCCCCCCCRCCCCCCCVCVCVCLYDMFMFLFVWSFEVVIVCFCSGFWALESGIRRFAKARFWDPRVCPCRVPLPNSRYRSYRIRTRFEHDQKCIGAYDYRQGIVLKHRHSLRKSPCPVVVCPYLCSSDTQASIPLRAFLLVFLTSSSASRFSFSALSLIVLSLLSLLLLVVVV